MTFGSKEDEGKKIKHKKDAASKCLMLIKKIESTEYRVIQEVDITV
jgi:hypothetical protein